MHLITRNVGRLTCFLHTHVKLDHIEKELQEILVLGIATLNRKAQEWFLIFESQGGREGHARMFSRSDDIERILRLAQHETLHSLAHANAGVACHTGGQPASAWGYGDDPAFVVSRLNRGRA